MENTAAAVLCLLACALPFALGIGITLLLRKWLPRAAYLIGFLIPVAIPVILWLMYSALMRATPPCPPGVVSCGEADAYTFLVLAGLTVFNFFVSAVIQFLVWLILRQQHHSKAITQ